MMHLICDNNLIDLVQMRPGLFVVDALQPASNVLDIEILLSSLLKLAKLVRNDSDQRLPNSDH